nr:capsid protein [Sichuan tick-associated circovirus 2]
MPKRKVTDYYRAVRLAGQAYQDARDKRYFSAAVNARRAYNSLPSSSNMVARKSFLRARTSKRRPRRRVVKRKRVTRKPRRRTRKSPKNGVQWKQGNILTLDYDNADTRQVPTGTANQGKQCTYLVNGQSAARPLGGLRDIQDMATLITNLEADNTNQTSDLRSFETKFVVKNSFQESTIINTSNASVLCVTYMVRCRVDIGTAQPYNDIIQILGDGFFQRGYTTGGNGSGNQGCTDASLSPFDSHKWCSYFQVMKTMKYELEAGATKILRVQTRKPYTLNTAHLFENNLYSFPAQFNPVLYHRRGEMFCFTKFEGIPADSSTGQWYTTPKLDMITKTHYNFAMLAPNPPLINRVAATGYTVPTATINIMQEEAGVNQVQTNA